MPKTHITVCLDRSGSMGPLVQETISGFNAWLKDAQQSFKDQEATISVLLFDNQMQWWVKDTPLDSLADLTRKTYTIRGYTALRDAFGNAVTNLNAKRVRGDRCLLVVMTDGQENASREFSPSALQVLIKKFESKNREIVFMGANIDAVTTGRDFGISRGQTISTMASDAGRRAEFALASMGTRSFAGGQSVNSAMSQSGYDTALAEEAAKETLAHSKVKK